MVGRFVQEQHIGLREQQSAKRDAPLLSAGTRRELRIPGRKPMRKFGIGAASPSNSRSSPAMIFRRLDLPEPFNPSTPIFAPGKNESEMSFRITRLGGTILPTRFMV